LVDAQGDTLGRAITDERGYFSFDLPESGEYSLVASALGYQAMQSEPVRVGAGEVRIVELSMETRPLPVEGMVVEARADEVQRAELRPTGFYLRLREGRGEFLTPGQIEASRARYPQQLFWGMASATTYQRSHDRPGIWNDVVVIRSRSGGYCRPSIYVDGVWIREEDMGGGESLADLVRKEDLLGVEVYQWPFGVPPQYAGKQSCGVILFWTDFS
ncbi:MAG: carboxypeptidase regulatory-like domain-containing protein, partial [Longimicrobiales bacterium]|nr:carboxypeptidase regulatory-like domain-containing protein [Longimicrobiales bacterium]